jgi:hypothetical protein
MQNQLAEDTNKAYSKLLWHRKIYVTECSYNTIIVLFFMITCMRMKAEFPLIKSKQVYLNYQKANVLTCS